MTKFFGILCLTLSLSLCSLADADIEVIVTGQAAGSGKIAKQQALADALRKAVRKGAGINIISRTKVTDYVLDFDRIFSRAFGYVKAFKILFSGKDNAGFFNVKISATVSKTSPAMNDYLAMRQIIALKGSPRLLIRASGKINDIGDAGNLIEGKLQEIALKCGFQTIKMSQFSESESNRTRRDKFIGKTDSAAYRNSAVRNNYDFIINVKVSGAYNGKSELYDLSTQRFSLGADISAAYPNGNAIAQITIPSREIDIMLVTNKTQAARAALQKILGGDKGKNFRALLVRVLASWVSEFDTGTKITIEFPKISHDLFEKIVDRLTKASGINAINIREFDKKLKSVIEVESNLKAYDLAKLISYLSDNKLEVERSTNDYIQMSLVKTLSSADLVVALGGVIVVLILLILIIRSLKSRKS